jgi:hypothetical protein
MEGLKFPKWSNNIPITCVKNWKDFLSSFFHSFLPLYISMFAFGIFFVWLMGSMRFHHFFGVFFLVVVIDLYVFLFAYSYNNTTTIIIACVSFGFCLAM